MPFLDWVNKNQAKEHVAQVPYHVLLEESVHGDVSGLSADNMLIEGDRLLAVEYKGQHLNTGDDADEKRQVGFQWEKSSGGRCLFLWVVERDDRGRDVFQQLTHKLQ